MKSDQKAAVERVSRLFFSSAQILVIKDNELDLALVFIWGPSLKSIVPPR